MPLVLTHINEKIQSLSGALFLKNLHTIQENIALMGKNNITTRKYTILSWTTKEEMAIDIEEYEDTVVEDTT